MLRMPGAYNKDGAKRHNNFRHFCSILAFPGLSGLILPKKVDTELSRKREYFILLRGYVINRRMTSFTVIKDFNVMKLPAASGRGIKIDYI